MRRSAIALIPSILVILMMAQPVQAANPESYPDTQGDLTRHTTFASGVGGWIYEWTPLGQALANVDIIESSLELTEMDGNEVYVFEMTTVGNLPTASEPQDIDLSSVVLLFWFWTIEFGYSDDYSFWNSYDVMLIWDCEARSYSTAVWDYRPCQATGYQPLRELVGIPAFEVDGASVELFMPIEWLPEDHYYDFCWMYVTAVRWGEYGLEDINNNGGFTGGRDYYVDWPDWDVVAQYPDPIPTSTRPWLYWSYP